MRRYWCASVVLGLTLSACDLCEYREYHDSFGREVALDESCPQTIAIPENHSNNGLRSVDGPPSRTVIEKAKQECCYTGTFYVDDALYYGTLCAQIGFDGRGDEAFADHCPSKQKVLPFLKECTYTDCSRSFALDDPPKGWAVDPDDVDELTSGPEAGEITLRKDSCVYPATFRTTADVCG